MNPIEVTKYEEAAGDYLVNLSSGVPIVFLGVA
jgi:hypothetical protein